MFKLGGDNKKDGIAVVELEIESVGFSESTLIFEIKLQNGVSHEFKCANLDEFLQWKRALADYRGSRSSAVETITFAAFARKILCMFVQEHGADALGSALGDEGGEGGDGDAAAELVRDFLPNDVEDDVAGDDDDMGGGLANLMEVDD